MIVTADVIGTEARGKLMAPWLEKDPKSQGPNIPRSQGAGTSTGFRNLARQVVPTWEQKRCGFQCQLGSQHVQLAVDLESSLFSDGGKPMKGTTLGRDQQMGLVCPRQALLQSLCCHLSREIA